jgi:membrane protein DedA with SNARE-associated domain
MTNTTTPHQPAHVKKGNWLRRNYVPLLTLLLVLAITVGLFLYRDRVADLGNYGYPGVFLLTLVANATVILPIPIIVLLFPLGAAFNPLFVGLAAGIAAPIGEITGYVAGYSGRGIAQRSKLYDRLVNWVKRWGALAIFIFSLVPFFQFDLAGIAAGVLRFPFWKFFLVCWLGRTILYTGVAFAGAWGWEAFVTGTLWTSPVSIAVLTALGVLVLLVLTLVVENRTWKRRP